MTAETLYNDTAIISQLPGAYGPGHKRRSEVTEARWRSAETQYLVGCQWIAEVSRECARPDLERPGHRFGVEALPDGRMTRFRAT